MKAYLIHGWGGNPENCWFPWLKTELEERGYEVTVPAMPNTDNPVIESWVGKLNEIIKPDENTILIGHSIGTQTILRYLQNASHKFAGIFLVAAFVNLKNLEDDEAKKTAEPWLTTPINWDAVKEHTNRSVVFLSDDDEFVDTYDGKIFLEKLNAKVIIQHNKGHFDDEKGILEIPKLLEEINHK